MPVMCVNIKRDRELLNKYHEIIIILAFVGFILASLKLAYGQSLAKLQSQVNNETGYRTELEGYINLHNISFSAANGDNHLNISDFDVFDLETLNGSEVNKFGVLNGLLG
jgi:hypothetical protein